MSYMLVMTVRDSLENLFNYMGGLPLREISHWDNLVKKFASTDQFLNQVQPALILKNFIQLDDIRMRQILENVDLVQVSNSIFFRHLIQINDFDCSEIVRAYSLASDNSSETSFTENISFIDLVSLG